MTERTPFRDMLGNDVQLGDIVFRPTIRTYEKVTSIKPYNPQRGPDRKFGTHQIRCTPLHYHRTLEGPWIVDGKNILKINMSDEVASAFTLMDRDLESFQPKLILDFKA